jgi:hypothetical protein
MTDARSAFIYGLADHLNGAKEQGYDPNTEARRWVIWAQGFDLGDFVALAEDVADYLTLDQLGQNAEVDWLRTELAALHQQIDDTARAIAKWTPPGDERYPNITAAIRAVHEHGFAMGAANAAAQIADALEGTPDCSDPRGPYFFTEAEWDRLSGLFLANSDVGLGSELDQAIFSKLVDSDYVALDPVEHIGPCEETTP